MRTHERILCQLVIEQADDIVKMLSHRLSKAYTESEARAMAKSYDYPMENEEGYVSALLVPRKARVVRADAEFCVNKRDYILGFADVRIVVEVEEVSEYVHYGKDYKHVVKYNYSKRRQDLVIEVKGRDDKAFETIRQLNLYAQGTNLVSPMFAAAFPHNEHARVFAKQGIPYIWTPHRDTPLSVILDWSEPEVVE